MLPRWRCKPSSVNTDTSTSPIGTLALATDVLAKFAAQLSSIAPKRTILTRMSLLEANQIASLTNIPLNGHMQAWRQEVPSRIDEVPHQCLLSQEGLAAESMQLINGVATLFILRLPYGILGVWEIMVIR